MNINVELSTNFEFFLVFNN